MTGTAVSHQACYRAYGSQLRNLAEALGNPLAQYVGIVICGDSIAWGRTLQANSTTSPQTPFLSAARDNSSSPSFWNLFRQYVARQYMKGASVAVSNWAGSPSGESVVTYTKPLTLYPLDGPFVISSLGPNQSAVSAPRATSPTGFMYTLTDGNGGGTARQSISFPFTGNQFTLIFRATNTGDFNRYDIAVNGVSVGTFTTEAGVDGVVAGDNNRRVHTFPFVRNGTITIHTNSAGLSGVRRLYLEGIEVKKTVRFTNQGIIGQTARSYELYNLSGAYPESTPVAVTNRDQFIFCQFGTNDRGDAGAPPGASSFERSLQSLVSRLTPLGDVIMMCASPCSDTSDPPSPVAMSMVDVRGVITRVARSNGLAFIDNLGAFDEVDPANALDGDVHPNELGHSIIARNMISAMESA